MRDEALFINGVYKNVLQCILNVQTYLPNQILYLQPYSRERIVNLANNPPSPEDPVRLFCSLTNDLGTVHFAGEIVGWEHKRKIGKRKLHILNRVIREFQPEEVEVYMTAGPKDIKCVNLLYVRRLRRLSKPFSVDKLTKTSDGEQVSAGRTTSGGWVYVANPSAKWLEAYL